MHRASYAGAAQELSWWAGSQLDPERLTAFGGMRHVRWAACLPSIFSCLPWLPYFIAIQFGYPAPA